MELLRRAQDILLRPKETWPVIKSEEMTIAGIYKSYALILAIIPAAAQAIGLVFIGTSFIGIRYRPSLDSTLGHAILSYCAFLASLYIVALVINSLAPKFSSQKNLTNAFKLVAYSWTPTWMAGILLLIPSLAWLANLVSLYGLYLLYHGLPILMETPREKATVYFLSAVVLSAVLIGFIFSVVALVL
ncbi:MAG TPA: Yip1 family protein [Syntrophorhabdales bacterium]|nr:Yip1 family protein [Syntrophorhabdales bacterium]